MLTIFYFLPFLTLHVSYFLLTGGTATANKRANSIKRKEFAVFSFFSESFSKNVSQKQKKIVPLHSNTPYYIIYKNGKTVF